MSQRPLLRLTTNLMNRCSKLTMKSVPKRRFTVSSVNAVQNRCNTGGCNAPCSNCRVNMKTFATAAQTKLVMDSEPYFHQVALDHDARMVNVEWEDGTISRYPYVWLRDNCQCPKCYEPASHARINQLVNISVDVKPNTVQVLDGSDEVKITWKDGHVSSLSSEWLWDRRFNEDGLKTRKSWLPLKSKTWGRDKMQDKIPSESFNNLLNDDKALYDWICTMEQEGLFMITDVPPMSGMCQHFSQRIAFLRLHNYGLTFTVKAKMDPSNVAWTSHELGFHTDLPYYNYCPGIQMLHCIKQVPTKGGESIFSDGFYVAEKLREERPDYFELLTTVPVDYQDMGTDYYKFHKLHRVPIISLNESGELDRITWNNHQRDQFLSVPLDKVYPLYEAMKYYNDMMYREDNHIRFKLQPGQIIVFHNYRVLHGRAGFEVLKNGERHLEGGYIDWDELYSRRRVLQAELGCHPHNN